MLAMWGCGMGVTELPSNTQPGGPGFLSITTQQINDGVQGVGYSTVINTSGGSGRLTTCTVTTGTLPAGFSFPTVSGSTCLLTTNGQPVTGAPGRYTFTLEAGDSSTPQRTDQRVYSLTIRPQFTIDPPVVLDGVTARSYTRTFTVTTNLRNHTGSPIISSTEAGNGPITQCVIGGLPPGFAAGGGSASCATDTSGVNVTVVMRAPAGTLAAGVYPFTISVTDSPIRSTGQAGVVAPASTTTIQPSLVVRQEFSLTQGALAEGVQGRTYGAAPLAQGVTTNTAATAPPVNSGQAAEFGNGPLTSCTLSVTPADPALSVSVDSNDPARCLLTSSAPVAAAGTYSVVVNATDSPILDPASPGAVVVPANTRQEQLTWTVAPPISYSLNFDSAQGQPGQVPAAVENRTYGSTPKTPLLVTATGGLSATTGLSMTVGGTLPAGIVCATPQPNPQPPGLTALLTCSSDGNPITASPGAASFTVTVSDPGNTATPPGSISSDALGHASHALAVEAPLALSANLADPLPNGVSGRAYGVAPAQPLMFTASGGLGGYSFTTPATIASPGAAFPQGIGCSQGAGNAANTYSCSAASITAVGSSTVNYGPVPVTVDDTANATTPDGASSSTAFTLDRTLTVEPPLSITPVAGIDPPPTGVQGRTYGAGSGFVPLAYVISGGDPPYTNFALPPAVASPASVGGSTPEGGVPAPIACANTVVGTTTEVVCSSSGAPVSAAPGAYPFSFSVSDSGSGETAAASLALAARTITIDAPLAWSGANPTSNAPPAAVQNRTYGGAGFTPLTYNATGGLGAYSFTLPPEAAAPGSNNLPAGAACAATSGTQVVCGSGASVVSAAPGNYSFSITVNDTANATTPGSQASNTAATVTKPLVVEPPLAFSPTSQSLLSAVVGRAYGQGPGCTGGNCQPFDFTLSGGLGAYQSTIASSNGIACALQADGKTYQCSSASVSGSPSTPTLNFSATDTANASTPSGSASGTEATATATLPINAAMTITAPATLAPAVAGRTYGSGAACSGRNCSPITFSIQGGLGGYGATPTLSGFPGAFACPFTSTGALSGFYSCSAASGVSGASPASLTISASDTANASAPAATVTSSPAASLTIYPEITVTGPSSLAGAVQGRTYGSGTTCGAGANVACQPIQYSVNGGLGGYSTTPTLDGYPTGFACAAPVNGSGPTPSATYACSSSGVTGAPASYNAGISVSDTANASTPAISAAKASNTANLVVNSPLSLTLTSGTPATAVDNRSFGVGSGCSGGGCAPISFSVSGGLGNGNYASSATITAAPAGTSIGFACPLQGTTTYTCSASNVAVTPTPTSAAPETITVAASDVANASTPSGTRSGTVGTANAALTVEPPFALKAASPASWAAIAVVGSSYGSAATGCTITPCAKIVYNASGGLGAYQPTAAVTPSGSISSINLTCSLTSPQYLCSTPSLAVSPSVSGSTSTTLTVTATDGNNASVPTQTASDNTVALTVNPALALTANPSSLPVGVTQRPYGVTGTNCGATGTSTCTNLTFTASGGTGTYTFPAPSGFPTGFSCTASGAVDTCSANPITAAGGPYLPIVTVNDAASASVIPGALPFNGSLTVQPPLTLTTTDVAPAALVNYPNYTSNALAATGGLPAYTWVAPGATFGGCSPAKNPPLPNGLSLAAGTGIFTGTATNASTADSDFSFGVCVTDTGNATTPPGSAYPAPGTKTSTLTLNVLNRYAFMADPGAGKVQVINTGQNVAPVTQPSVSSPIPQAGAQNVAVTYNGRYVFATLPAANQYAIIDTITGTVTTNSFPSGITCTAPHGVAISPDDSSAYFICSGNNTLVQLNISNITSITGKFVTTPKVPEAVAVSSDSQTVYVADSTPELAAYIASSITTAPATLPLSSAPVAMVLASNSPSSSVYAYIAETKSGSPGQVEVINVTSQRSVTGASPIAFAAVGATNPEPTCIAVTPDSLNSRVYVGLAATDQFAVINNSSTVTLAGQFNLPDPTKAASSSPAGVAIPPLATLPATGYRVFFTSVNTANGGEVDIIDDNNTASHPNGTPTADATTLTPFGTGSTPQGIANIPVPTAP